MAQQLIKFIRRFIATMKSLGIRLDMKENMNSHIILGGFKHVGKTFIGKKLARSLGKEFIDLDHSIEEHYEAEHTECLTCRQIMQLHGDIYYRELEKLVLQKVLQSPSAVIALGGGTLLDTHNQEAIKSHLLLHVIAPRGIVFERIMISGRPAFFDSKEDPYTSFTRLWEERSTVYKKLTAYTIDNNSSLDHAINQAKACLKNAIEKAADKNMPV